MKSKVRQQASESKIMVQMTIEGVALDINGLTVVVLREREGDRLLPIWIGPNEARAIQSELESAHPPRPMTHDLLLSLVLALGGRLTRIIINALCENTFYAEIELETTRGLKQVDARPSDAIALAVRAKCPIFVSGNALNALVDETPEDSQSASPAEADETAKHKPLYADESSEEVARFKRLLGEE